MEYSGTTSLEYVRTKPLFLTRISKNKCYNIYFLRTNTSRFTDCRIHDVRRKSLVFFLGTLSSVWMQIHDIFKQHICNVISFKNGSHWHFQYYWYFLLVFFFFYTCQTVKSHCSYAVLQICIGSEQLKPHTTIPPMYSVFYPWRY